MARDPVYARLGATATRLVSRFDQYGVDVLVEVVTQPTNPIDPPIVTTTPRAIKLVARGVSQSYLSSDPNLKATDVMIIIDGDQWYKPDVQDKITLNGEPKQIVRVDRVPASGDPLLYKFFVR